MAWEGRACDHTRQDANELELIFVLFWIVPEEPFCQVLAFGVIAEQILLRPILLIADLAVSADDGCQAGRCEDQSFDFVL